MRHKRKYINNQTRDIVYSRYDGHCAYCGRELSKKEMVVDHYIPLSRWKKGGAVADPEDISNYMPSCASCNYWKKSKSIEGFRKEISQQYGRLYKNSAVFRNLLSFRVVEKFGSKIKFYFENHMESAEWENRTGYKLPINPCWYKPYVPYLRKEEDNDE